MAELVIVEQQPVVEVVQNSNTESVSDPRQVVSLEVPQGLRGEPGIVWRGTYSAATTYNKGDVVYYQNRPYIVVSTNSITGVTPVDSGSQWNQVVANGAQWYNGTSAPSGSTGAVNDYFLNTTNGDVYKKTGTSTWTLQGNIKGVAGNITTVNGKTGPDVVIEAGDITLGTLSDARLSSNVVLASSTQTITGTKTFTAAPSVPSINVITTSGNAAIEIGRTDGTASSPLIDFHSGATAIDYDARISASGGTGTNGGGSLSITAASATFSGTISGNGSGLTTLNASNLSSGTVADARLSTNVPLKNTAQTFTAPQTVQSTNGGPLVLAKQQGAGYASGNAAIVADTDNTSGTANFLFQGRLAGTNVFSVRADGLVTGSTFSGSGASLTALNASNISSGTIADARLSTNVVLANSTQTISGTKTFSLQPLIVPPTGLVSENSAFEQSGVRSWNSKSRFTSPTIESSTDGTTWTADPGKNVMLDGKNTTWSTISAGTSVRFSWNSGWAFGNIKRLHVAARNSNPAGNLIVLAESSADGTTWTTRASQTISSLSQRIYTVPLTDNGSDAQYRLTITAQTNSVSITYLDLMSNRQGDQGAGPENEVPYDWNINKDVIFSGVVSGNGSGLTTLNASNLSSGTVADARLSSNVVFADTAQGITGAKTFTRDIAADNVVMARNLNAAGTSAYVAQDDVGTRYMTVGVANSTGQAGGSYGLPGEAILRGSGQTTGVAIISSTGTPIRFVGGGTEIARVNSTGFSGNGSQLTALNGSNISTGTVADARLSTNVVLANSTQTISGTKTFTANVNNFTSSSTSATYVRIGNTSTGVSGLVIDASDGDFVGSDYVTITQNNDLSAEIRNFGGDIELYAGSGGTPSLNIRTSQITSRVDQSLPGTAGNHVLIGSHESTGQMNQFKRLTFIHRNGAGTDWTTAEHIEGIGIDSSFNTPATTKTWWKRFPQGGTQSFGDAGTTHLTISSSSVDVTGNLGLPGDKSIIMTAAGVAEPTTTTRSVGTKIVLYPSVGPTAVDYAIGVSTSTVWQSVPSNVVGNYFRWFGGTVNVATLNGVGDLSLAGGATVAGNVTTNGDITVSSVATHTAPLASIFGTDVTKKNYIRFGAAVSSSDPGFIMHETSSITASQNRGVIHICPTDDSDGTNDYVAIHGTDDPETIKIYTNGAVTTPAGITASTFTGSGAALTALNAGNISTGTLALARGGTNSTATPASGGVIYSNGTAMIGTAAGTSGQLLTSGGTGAPTWSNQNAVTWRYDVPSTAGAPVNYLRVATINGGSATSGGHMNFIFSGNGDYGLTKRGMEILSFVQRGDNIMTGKCYSFNSFDILNNDKTEFFYKQISTYVFEIWMKIGEFTSGADITFLSNHNGTVNMDSQTTTVPTGLVAITPLNIDDSPTRVYWTSGSSPTRPPARYVEWVGPTQPTGALAGDTWVNTA